MRSTIFFIAISLLFSLSSCKEKKKNNIVEPPTAIVSETPAPVAEVKKEEPKPVVKQLSHYLVAGCFRVEANADRLHTKLTNEGYPAQILPYRNRYYLVTYEGFENRASAQISLNRIVREKGKKGTWVYPVR